jgi:hypothetical protein
MTVRDPGQQGEHLSAAVPVWCILVVTLVQAKPLNTASKWLHNHITNKDDAQPAQTVQTSWLAQGHTFADTQQQ